jgi:hypothetical protein
MTETCICDYCGEEIEEEPIRRGDKVYCCDACAFEASRSADCGGRSDSTFSQPIVEQA